ncbi:MAG: trypsin-like peptidase domain-containing protein [Candidatus Pedobacter colombiensis]|uniref:Trypsin-like peptidase domain-containing protein n=1 Tax=Candidatus Pedobacter colombiensis TaxID=3121371 RepID=A0AAJ6B5I7_9SPHI|nr:trypsin-like peptidase domain-containing protein [Pedobacter sp.]WEK17521.1 MAG: trypsin-like peptidase domain-containing protein [Pedobacter sp.]
MKKQYLYIVFVLLITCCHTASFGQNFNRKEFEATIRKGIEKAYGASVRIWGIDTVTKRQNSAQFSGVVVDTMGHILTAAHAIVPGKRYKVIFPSGKEFLAEGMGKMGFEPKTGRPDAAMIKIIEKGSWPVAEMGWSSSLKVNEPCISIAYPTTLNQPLPTIRVGRISNPLTPWGFVESSCKMEPGDSGGPLFDYMGRVIALHSRIDKSELINFEIPVDTYRKYWTALSVADTYEAYPSREDGIKNDPLSGNIISFEELENLTTTFSRPGAQFEGKDLRVKSMLKGEEQQIFSTVILPEGKVFKDLAKEGSILLSKSSMVGEQIMVAQGTEWVKATVIARDKESDLVLLRIAKRLKNGIKLTSADTSGSAFSDLGRFLISPLNGQDNRVSVLGSGYFKQPIKFSSGYFGASANFKNEQIILTRINPDSPAEIAKLQLGDQITGINGIPINKPEQYGAELMKYAPGDTITIQGIREGNSYNLNVALTKMPVRFTVHPADQFDGGKSFRLDGFEQVFAHDAILKPEECGGPVFDLDGKFYGINIARFSRTSCLVISPKTIYDFALKSLQN